MDDLSVLILDGESSFATATAWCLASIPNVAIHVLSSDADAPLRGSNATTSFHHHHAADDRAFVDQVTATVRRVGANVCVGVDEKAIRLMARHVDEFAGIAPCAPVPSLGSLDIAADKWELARFLERHRLAHPDTVLCSADRAFDHRIDGLSFPVLLKPRRGSNGIGIKRFEDASQLRRYLTAVSMTTDDPVASNIVQSVVTGWDIDCSVLCAQGDVLAHTIQKGFIAQSGPYRPAGGIEFLQHEKTLALVRRLMAALKWNGVAHVDLRFDERAQDVKVIEINPRFWGSLMGSFRAGVNFPYLTCLVALGKSFPTPVYQKCRYVGGQAALGSWLRGRIGARRSGFRFEDTAFSYALKDPGPHAVELLTWGKARAKTGVETVGTVFDRTAVLGAARKLIHGSIGVLQPRPAHRVGVAVTQRSILAERSL